MLWGAASAVLQPASLRPRLSSQPLQAILACSVTATLGGPGANISFHARAGAKNVNT